MKGIRIQVREAGTGSDISVNGVTVGPEAFQRVQSSAYTLASMKLAALVRRNGMKRFGRLRFAVANRFSCPPYCLVKRVDRILRGVQE